MAGDFSEHLERQGLALTTRRAYVRAAERWGDDPVAWLVELVNAETPQGTLLNYRGAATQWLRWKGREAEIVQLPRAAKLVQRSYRDGLTPGELERFLIVVEAGLVAPYNDIVLLLTRAGLRISEAVRVEARHLREQGGRVGLVVIGKGRKERWVPLAASTAQRLQTLAEGAAGGYLFPGKKGHVREDTVRMHLRKLSGALEAQGIEGVHPHKLRHTFATLLFDRGAELRVVQDLLGHADPKVTARYAQPTARKLGEAVDLLNEPG
jgi:integrase